MKQRLVSLENVTTVPRTFVYYADTLEDLYYFMEQEFYWFNREKFEIKVSNKRMNSIGRKFIVEDVIPYEFEDLYIKLILRKTLARCVENSEKINTRSLVGCGAGLHK